MPPSKCPRCGAATQDALCARCVEYLTQYHPLWLDPELLPGPSVLDPLDPADEAWLSIAPAADLEWHPPPPRALGPAAVAVVDGLRIGEGQVLLSEGDADILHEFLSRARVHPPTDPKERWALAALCRHIASIPSMPPHLADEYATRARVFSTPPEPAPVAQPPPEAPPTPVAAEEPKSPPLEVEAEEPAAEDDTDADLGLAADLEEFDLPPSPPVEEIPPPMPGPAPEPGPRPEPGPGPEPSPEPEEDVDREEERALAAEALRAARETAERTAQEAERIAGLRSELEGEKARMASWVERQSRELEARESAVVDRVKTIKEKEAEVRAKEQEAVAKVSELEGKERDVRQRMARAERDELRRAVMEFLDTVPGMTIRTETAIATAFPDMESLRRAEVRALVQCEGVSEAMATHIHSLVAPEASQGPMDLREQAQLLLEDGDDEGAVRVIDQYLRDHADDEAAWFDKAELMIMLGRLPEALQCYNRVIGLNRKNRQAWYEKANILFGAGRFVDAIECLKEVLRLDPSKSVDILLKAEELRMGGKLNDAVLLFHTVLDMEPENPRAVLGLGDCLMSLGDNDAAETLVTRALGKDPSNPGALYRKGALLNRKGRWGGALQLYNRAIALQWDYPDPWNGKGEIYLKQEKSKDALECFNKAIEFDGKSVRAWLGKAQAHRALGEKGTAEQCLNYAVKLAPHEPGVREVAELFERVEEAVREEPEELPADFKAFIEAVEPEKEETETLLQLAEMALEGGDPEMAIVRYAEALKKDMRSADAWTGKGIALQYKERYAEAMSCYEKALEIRPGHELALKWRETCAKRLREAGP